MHKELDLGRAKGSRSSSHLDRAAGGWRLAWNFDEPWHLERAVRDLCHELAIFDRFPTYDEMRRHGWGRLCTHTHTHTHTHTFIHTYDTNDTYIHTYIRTYVYTYIRMYVYTYVCMYVYSYIRMIHTYTRMYLP